MNEHSTPRQGSTRYGHSGVGGGSQERPERKDEGWQSRQGGRQSRPHGRGAATTAQGQASTKPPSGTNTQGDLAGIAEAAEEVERQLPLDEAGTPTVPDR